MKAKTLLATLLLATFSLSLHAQNEYRISQSISNEINDITIRPGWNVVLKQGTQPSLTIVTTCQAFFDDGTEPEVCTIKEQSLELLENTTMPKSTVIEIVLSVPIESLYVGPGSSLTTDNLRFSDDWNNIEISDSAIVRGKSWHSNSSYVKVGFHSELTLDTLEATKRLTVICRPYSKFECPAVISPDTKIKKDKRSLGTPFQSDSIQNIKVKETNNNWWHHIDGISLSGGISAPIPLYMNNKSGSAYNRGESYRITLQAGFLRQIELTRRLSFNPTLRYDWEWHRLLNNVVTDGNSLTLTDTPTAEQPQQHILSQYVGINLGFTYAIGKKDREKIYPYHINFGLSGLYNISGRLATRTMGTDNRWNRTNVKTDIFNPWQIRANVGIGGGHLLGRFNLNLTYDLLPTFRSGIGAKDIRTFGVSISF